MSKPFILKDIFTFPPKSEKDLNIMRYLEFLEIEFMDPVSPEIYFSVSIDTKSIKGDSKFIEFLSNCGKLEMVDNNRICDYFKYTLMNPESDLVFFVYGKGGTPLLIDKKGYIHLSPEKQNLDVEDFRLLRTTITDFYGFNKVL